MLYNSPPGPTDDKSPDFRYIVLADRLGKTDRFSCGGGEKGCCFNWGTRSGSRQTAGARLGVVRITRTLTLLAWMRCQCSTGRFQLCVRVGGANTVWQEDFVTFGGVFISTQKFDMRNFAPHRPWIVAPVRVHSSNAPQILGNPEDKAEGSIKVCFVLFFLEFPAPPPPRPTSFLKKLPVSMSHTGMKYHPGVGF